MTQLNGKPLYKWKACHRGRDAQKYKEAIKSNGTLFVRLRNGLVSDIIGGPLLKVGRGYVLAFKPVIRIGLEPLK